jgi:hypothetical protein
MNGVKISGMSQHLGVDEMRDLRGLLVALLGVALGGCSTMEISTDYNPSANFSGLRSYNWLPGPQGNPDDPRINNSLLDGRIRSAVESQLAAQGYEKQVSGTPDFFVGYHAAVEKKLDVITIDDYYSHASVGGPGYRPGSSLVYGHQGRTWGGSSQTHVVQYDEGTLILDIVDPQTRKLLWRGSAQAEVNLSGSPEKKQEKVNEAVRRMLERFPPQ